MAELNDRQKRFVAEYLVDLNGKQAAIRAGYKEASAEVHASRLLRNDKVKAEIAQKAEEVSNELTAKAQEVLEMLTRCLRREEKENVVVKVKTRRSYYDDKGKKVIEDTEEPKIVQVPSKLSDAIKAAEAMGKYHALFTDRMDINSDSTITLGFAPLPDGASEDGIMG